MSSSEPIDLEKASLQAKDTFMSNIDSVLEDLRLRLAFSLFIHLRNLKKRSGSAKNP